MKTTNLFLNFEKLFQFSNNLMNLNLKIVFFILFNYNFSNNFIQKIYKNNFLL